MTEHIFYETDSSWRQIESRFSIISLYPDGLLERIITRGTFQENTHLDDLLSKKVSVFEFFDFGDSSSLENASSSKKLYLSRPSTKEMHSDYIFHTNLPLFTVSINRRKSGLYIAVISPNRVLSPLSVNSQLPLFLVDRNKCLRAYNEAFRELAGATYGTTLLNCPIDKLITPWLDELSIASKSGDKKSELFQKVSSGTISAWIADKNKDFSELLLSKLGNSRNKKIRVTVCGFINEGKPPLLVVRGNFNKEIFLCGPSAVRENITVYKKYGYVVWDAPLSAIGKGEAGEWEWMFDSNHIVLNEKKKDLSFAYRDMEGINIDNAAIGLMMRSGCEMTNIEWSIEQSKEHFPEEQQLFSFRKTSGKNFLMHHVYHTRLASAFPNITAYGLREVTALYSRLTKQKEDKSSIILGESASIVKTRSMAKTVAASDATILIEGETGTGKGLLASYIHNNSRFSKKEMVTVDCSSIPKTLVETELFGVEKGAFTGAVSSRIGKFEEADGTTLFLDEINSLDLDIQSRLLKFLEDFSVVRVGGNKPKRLDVRVIAASNNNLSQLVERDLFRKDLYYRLNMIALKIPPLRERKEDIPILSISFLKLLNIKYNRNLSGFDAETIREMANHDWPGNVRELKNTIEQAVIFCGDSNTISSDLLNMKSAKNTQSDIYRRESFRLQLDKDTLKKLLFDHDNNISKICKALACSRSTLYYNMKKTGLVKTYNS